MGSDSGNAGWLEWAAAGRPLDGEPESADRAFVDVRTDTAVVAVVDGLGHGADAVRAAKAATAALELAAPRAPIELVLRVHAALVGTRGAVVSVAVLDARRGTLAWVGVGDVEAILHRGGGRPRETLLLRGGVVGDCLPPLRAAELQLSPGDTLVLATDGLRRAFMDEPALQEPPRAVAARLLALHARPTDDALVLVVRFRGAQASGSEPRCSP